MTLAELHGKLAAGRTNGYETMEDLLTSDVFGTMRYAGWEFGFLDWLHLAEAAPVEPRPPAIGSLLPRQGLLDVQISFWPRLNNNREPDLALLARYDGLDVLVLVEAKYQSGMSDYETDALEHEDALTGDQVLDQVRGMERMAPVELLNWFQEDSTSPSEPVELHKVHLLVTKDSTLPREVYQRSTTKKALRWPPCYWLSWTTLAACIKPYLAEASPCQRALLHDLYRLLHRKGLVNFRNGFTLAPWTRHLSQTSFWQERWWSERSWSATTADGRFWEQRWWQSEPWLANSAQPSFWRGLK